jgi:hypothetical protein
LRRGRRNPVRLLLRVDHSGFLEFAEHLGDGPLAGVVLQRQVANPGQEQIAASPLPAIIRHSPALTSSLFYVFFHGSVWPFFIVSKVGQLSHKDNYTIMPADCQ